MATTKQDTFGRISVNHYTGNRKCDASTGMKPNGEPKKCTNSAHYAVLRHLTGVAEFYCKTHGKEDWDDIGNNVE